MCAQVGTQDVCQHQRIARVALGPADRVAVSIPRHGQRIDREQLVARRRSAAGSNPFAVSIAIVIGASLAPACSANSSSSSLNPAALSSMRRFVTNLPSLSTRATS
jgi:hypothetical protein